MCIICREIDRDRMTSNEAYKAAGGGEFNVEPEHAYDLIEKIEKLRRSEESDTSDISDKDLNAGD